MKRIFIAIFAFWLSFPLAALDLSLFSSSGPMWSSKKYHQREIAIPESREAFLIGKENLPDIPFSVKAEILTISPSNWMGIALCGSSALNPGQILLFRFCPERNGKSAYQILLYDATAGQHKVLCMKELDEKIPGNTVVFMDICRKSRTLFYVKLSDMNGKVYYHSQNAIPNSIQNGYCAFYSAAKGGMGALHLEIKRAEGQDLSQNRPDDSKYVGYWIRPEDKKILNNATFRKKFFLEEMPKTADIAIAAENKSTVFINGKEVGQTKHWMTPENFSITKSLHSGENCVEIRVQRQGNTPVMIADLSLWDSPEKVRIISSDDSWEVITETSHGYAQIVPSDTEKSGPPWGPLKRIYGGPLPEFLIGSAEIPSTIEADSPFYAKFIFKKNPLAYGTKQIALSVEKDNTVFLSLYPVKRTECQIEYAISEIPSYIPEGNYEIKLFREGTSEKKYTIATIHLKNRNKEQSNSQYLRDGKLYINQQQSFFLGMLGRYPQYSTDEVRNFGTGINVCKVSFPLCSGWVDNGHPEQIDFQKLDESVYNVLSANPKVKLLVNMEIMPPSWYIEKYPEERIGFADPIPPSDAKTHPYHRQKNISLISEQFRKDISIRLATLIEHLQKAPYKNQILGVSLFGGQTGEWMHWSSTHIPVHFSGYSNATLQKFRIWLRKKYKTVQNLQQAWNDTSISFDSAKVPEKEDYFPIRSEYPFLRRQKNEDFLQFYSEGIVETLNQFCTVIKSKSGNQYLTGVYYGYTLYLPRHAWIPMTGHCAMEQLLQSKNIDFILSPYNYAVRGAGGDCMPMVCHSSLKLHNKMFIAEADVRTHLAVDTLMAKENIACTPEQSEAIIKRDIASAAMLGNGLYWACVRQPTRHWFDAPEIQNADKITFSVVKKNLQDLNDASVPVAFFIDEKADFRLAPGSLVQKYLLTEQILTQMNRSGIGWDVYVLSDFEKVADKYKVLVFPNLFYVTPEMQEAIQKRKNCGRTLIFQYAPAILNEPSVCKNLTDFLLEKTCPEQTFSERCPGDVKSLVSYRIMNQNADILKMAKNQEPVVAAIRKTIYTSVFIRDFRLSPGDWRKIFSYAGITVAAEENDVVYARGSFLLLHTASGGHKKLHLANWTSAKELFSGIIYPINNGVLDFPARKHETYWFKMNNE